MVFLVGPSLHPETTFACASGYREPRPVTFKAAPAQSWPEEHAADESSFGSILSKMKLLVSPPLSTSVAQARALVISNVMHGAFNCWHRNCVVYTTQPYQLKFQATFNLFSTITPPTLTIGLNKIFFWQDRFSSSF